MRRYAALALALLCLAGCATQRYGRLADVSPFEAQEMNCRELRLERARAEAFLADVRRQRSQTNAAHVLGFLGDFGIGNVMEGNEAEASGEHRLGQLQQLSIQKGCPVIDPAPPSWQLGPAQGQ